MWPYGTHRNLPPTPKGYPLAPLGSWFSVVVPIARTNQITESSFEIPTTKWTAIGGSIARSTAQQYHGAYSLAITPSAATTDGARYDTVSMAASQLYAYSAKVLGVAGLKYKLCVETTGGAELAAVTFTATGRWQWVYGYWQETSSTTRRITIRKANHASVAVFYLDGVQVEAINTGEYVSTYIDGDQLGLVPNQFPAAYLWSGTPHASTSSRSGQTRAGGMVMRLDYYGFMLLTVVGLGMITPNNVSVPYVQLDGAQYERTQKPPRQFTLAGRWDSAVFPNLQRQISALGEVLDRDYIGQQQPLTLLYQGIDDCGKVFSDTGRIVCSYQGGMEGATDNLHSEQSSIVMRAWLPLIQGDGEIGAALSVQQTITNTNGIAVRSPGGLWSAISTGISGGGASIQVMVAANDGSVYIGGDFTTAGGVAAASIAKYDPATGTFSALGTGATGGSVQALVIGPDGTLYAGGRFTGMGGVANTNSIAKWNGSAWSALGTGATTGNGVEAAVIGVDGSLYVGGTFTVMGGVANTVRIAKWNGSAWSALSTGANGSVLALTRGGVGDTNIYAGGGFTTIGGTAVNFVAKWNGSAWVAMGGGASGGGTTSVASLAAGPDGSIYMGWGAGGGVASIDRWNGTAWVQIGDTDDQTYILFFDRSGIMYAGGDFTTISGLSLPDRGARWTGSAWLPLDIDFPGSPRLRAFIPSNDGTLYAGFTTTGSAVAAAVTTVTNPGTAKTYPRIVFKGPSSGTSRIYQLVNYTTGRAIYLNYTINAGETAVLTLNPDNLSFVSDFQGNLISTIIQGSLFADFFLQPRDNAISCYAANSTVTAVLTARPQYNAIADLTP